MSDDLQKQCENSAPNQIMAHLTMLYQGQARNERFNTARELYNLRMSDRESVSTHGVRFLGLLKRLSDLGFPIPDEMAVDLLLNSLPPSWSRFVMNYNLNEIQFDPAGLFNKLKIAEVDMKGSKGTVLMVSTQKPKSTKGKKGDQKKKPLKAKDTAKKKKSEPKGTCFFCNVDGHWKRNCKLPISLSEGTVLSS